MAYSRFGFSGAASTVRPMNSLSMQILELRIGRPFRSNAFFASELDWKVTVAIKGASVVAVLGHRDMHGVGLIL